MSISTAIMPSTILDDDAWDDLLSFIEERRVIPILGPELLMVTTESGPRLLVDWFTGKLARLRRSFWPGRRIARNGRALH
jgi:hypothetical protein